MRSFARNSAADPIIEALVAGGITEDEARLWIRNVLTVEREGFGQRILRRLPEARFYHHGQSQRDRLGMDELLSAMRVTKIIREEVAR